MARNSTLPNLRDTLVFCGFLLDCSQEDYQDNLEWTREVKWHRNNLKSLLNFMDEGKEDTSMEMSRKSYEQAEKTFGKALAARLFASVRIVDHFVPPVNAEKLFADIKAKGSASRTKEVKQPTGFFSESAGKAFEDALFHRNGTNGHKGMPTMATTFSQLRQARIEGELAEQFTMLTQNILQSSEFTADVKAQKLAALASEYSQLSKGGN